MIQSSNVLSLSWSSDGKVLAFSYGQHGSNISPDLRPQIFLIDLETDKTTRLTNDLYEYWSAGFSPVHNLIALQRVGGGSPNQGPEYTTVIQDLDTHCQIDLPLHDTNFASWSPDGQKLVISALGSAYIVDLSEYLGPVYQQTGSICP